MNQNWSRVQKQCLSVIVVVTHSIRFTVMIVIIFSFLLLCTTPINSPHSLLLDKSSFGHDDLSVTPAGMVAELAVVAVTNVLCILSDCATIG